MHDSSRAPAQRFAGRRQVTPRGFQAGPLLPGLVLAALLAGCGSRPSRFTPLEPPRASAPEASGPGLVIDPASGDVMLCWLAGADSTWRIWFARSRDRGRSWSAPVAVSPPGEPVSLDPESSPVMVSGGKGQVGLAWSTSVAIPGQPDPASDVRFARSRDGGRTWSAPVTVNDDAANGPGHHSRHSLEVLPDGALIAAWIDGRPGGERLDADESEGIDASIQAARSNDFGLSWGANAPEWSRVCPACRVGLAADLIGRPVVAFRRHFPGQVRDVVVGRLDSPPVRAHIDEWSAPDAPACSPVIEFSRDATLRLAWYTGAPGWEGVWFRETLPELLDSVSVPLPVLRGDRLPIVHVGLGEAGMSGSLVACDADSTGERALTLVRVVPSGRRVAERVVVPGTRGASYPSVAASPVRRDAYVAWTTRERGRSEIRLLRWNAGR